MILQYLAQVFAFGEFLERQRPVPRAPLERLVRRREHRQRFVASCDHGRQFRDVQRAEELGESSVTERAEIARRRRRRFDRDRAVRRRRAMTVRRGEARASVRESVRAGRGEHGHRTRARRGVAWRQTMEDDE